MYDDKYIMHKGRRSADLQIASIFIPTFLKLRECYFFIKYYSYFAVLT